MVQGIRDAGVHEVNLEALSENVFDKTNYNIAFESKDTAPTDDDIAWFEMHKPFMADLLKEQGLRPDRCHRARFLKLFKDKAYQTTAGNFLYNDANGLWVNTESDVMSVLLDHEDLFQTWSYDKRENMYIGTTSKPTSALIRDMYGGNLVESP